MPYAKKFSFVLAVTLALVAALILLRVIQDEMQSGWGKHEKLPAPGAEEAEVKAVFLSDRPASERYGALFDYFARGFLRHAEPGFARVQYPGAGSANGFELAGVEGFARTAPLLAAKVHSGWGSTIVDPESRHSVEIIPLLKAGILAGVDPRSPAFWGEIADLDQRIVESADIARVLWLTKAQLWDGLTGTERELIARWLHRATTAKTFDNNWQLFPITVGLVLAHLNEGASRDELIASALRKFAQYREFYLESGWFMDEQVDFYNAWGITYELFWMSRIASSFESHFIRKAVEESAHLTKHLISPRGIPIMGRSVCYRTAVPVPVIAASLLHSGGEAAAEGFRALDVVWRYFIEHDILRDGTLTQGYLDSDPRYLDFYSGPGSCHWGLRSLVLAFMHPPQARFWAGEQARLPIEVRDFRREYPRLGWNIEGHRATGEIIIEIPANPHAHLEPQEYTWRARLKEMLTREPHRPKNRTVQYGARYYSSAKPFPVHGTYSKSD